MSDPLSADRLLSVEEYLAFEERSPLRHEYVAGAVYAMTGATIRHSIIVGNVFTALRAAAAGGPCRVFQESVKVRTANDVFYYPDVVVHCTAVDEDAVYVRDPCLIVEVTSPNTRRTDRREKLLSYRALPSVRAYLIVEQRRRQVEVHLRDASGEWDHATVAGHGTVTVPCPATTLTLDAIYEGVTLPMLGEPEPPRYALHELDDETDYETDCETDDAVAPAEP
jgi:Uma2 family endonuclease